MVELANLVSGLYRDDKLKNNKLIISAHGAQRTETFKTPVELKFPTKQNYGIKGPVTNILAMAESEFQTEPKDTSGLSDYDLAYYPFDKASDIQEAVDAGFDVLTIKPQAKPTLVGFLSDKSIVELHYTVVYCLFCRVAAVAQYVKVM